MNVTPLLGLIGGVFGRLVPAYQPAPANRATDLEEASTDLFAHRPAAGTVCPACSGPHTLDHCPRWRIKG